MAGSCVSCLMTQDERLWGSLFPTVPRQKQLCPGNVDFVPVGSAHTSKSLQNSGCQKDCHQDLKAQDNLENLLSHGKKKAVRRTMRTCSRSLR